MKPLISVVIPIYNSERTLGAVLHSVIKQNYRPIEIILVNDGSVDNSKTLIEEFMEAYPNEQVYCIDQINQGVSVARNNGMKNSNGDYIALLDSDDIWKENKLSLQMKAFHENENIDLLATNRNGEKFDTFFNLKFKKITKIPPKLLLYKNFLLTPTVLFKREIIDEVGYFNEKMTHSEDLEYFLKIAVRFKCYLYNESMVTTGFEKPTFGHSGLSKNIWKMEKGELRVLTLGYRLKIVSFFEFIFIVAFSILKFLRRVLITASR